MMRNTLLAITLILVRLSAYGQDSTGLGQTVRIVRAYDPHLPEWFRLSSDPILLVEPTARIPMSYRPDSLSFIQSFGPIPKYTEPSLASSSLQPRIFKTLSITGGGLPGSQINAGIAWSSPFKMGSQVIFAHLECLGSSGNPNRLWADSIQSLAIWNSRLAMEWRPARNREWNFLLNASQRCTGFNYQDARFHNIDSNLSKDTSLSGRWNTLRVNPRITWNRVSQRIEGFHQHLRVEGLGAKLWNTFLAETRLHDLGSEWTGITAYEVGYHEENRDMGVKAYWSTASLKLGIPSVQNTTRSTFSIKPHWVWLSGPHRLSASMDFIRQREPGDSSSTLKSFWATLPEFIWQYQQPIDSNATLRHPWMIEVGILSGIKQPSMYQWGSVYPTLSVIDVYQASIQRAEGFVRLEHSIGERLRWEHRVGIGSWKNPRFFGLDTLSVLGVSTVLLPRATQWSWETKVSLKETNRVHGSIRAGMQGIVSNRTWYGMPGLQPVFWGGLHLTSTWGKVWALDFQSTAYALDSQREIFDKLSENSSNLKWPVDLDLRLNRSLTKNSTVAIVYRHRQAAAWFLWSEDVWWGRLLNVEWRWKI